MPIVASFFNLTNNNMGTLHQDGLQNMYPWPGVIGVSVQSGREIQILASEKPIVINFRHSTAKVIFSGNNISFIIVSFQGKLCARQCTFWDLRNSAWSTKGCYLDPYESSEYETSCKCYHLTNFGIMMDFTGNADPFNNFLDYFSVVTIILSLICIMLAELILHMQR